MTMAELAFDKEQAWLRTLDMSYQLDPSEASDVLSRYTQANGSLPETSHLPGPFDIFATIALQHPSRLLRSSCCPDKDLVVLITSVSHRDRISLWKMQGSKKWEVDAAKGGSPSESVTSVVWSPDGQSIAVALDPPRLSILSIQNGREERSIKLSDMESNSNLIDIWWVRTSQNDLTSDFPDILRRGDRIPGSALSVLRMLPLLDPIGADNTGFQSLDLFAFNTNQRRPAPKPSHMPSSLVRWPSLLGAASSASIASKVPGGDKTVLSEDKKTAVIGETTDTLVLCSDSAGFLHLFLDGSFSLGKIGMNATPESGSLIKMPAKHQFLMHPQHPARHVIETALLLPMSVSLPLLDGITVRQVATVSSSIRELLWYSHRAVSDMRETWFGVDGSDGPRTLGAKWLKKLEDIQRLEWGYSEKRGILEMTGLLITGQPSQPLSSILSAGESTSERRLTKWESTITDALVKLRDVAEKKLHPACQRIHLLAEEVKGWSSLSQLYGDYDFDVHDVDAMLQHVAMACYLSSWLAVKAREELRRFKIFMLWLRLEAQNAQMPAGDTTTPAIPTHDPLEVNRYLISGFESSEIDLWFEGPEPDQSLLALFESGPPPLSTSLMESEKLLESRSEAAWSRPTQLDLGLPNRNLVLLFQSLCSRGCDLFTKAAEAVSRCADVTEVQRSRKPVLATQEMRHHSYTIRSLMACDAGTADASVLRETFGAYVPSSTDANLLCIFRLEVSITDNAAPVVTSVELSINACVPKFMDAAKHQYQILDFDFLDDHSLAAVIRHLNRSPDEGTHPFAVIIPCSVETMKFEVFRVADRTGLQTTREDLIRLAVRKAKEAQVAINPLPFKRIHELQSLSRKGSASLSLNARRGVACILDETGMLECLDLATEPLDLGISDFMEE